MAVLRAAPVGVAPVIADGLRARAAVALASFSTVPTGDTAGLSGRGQVIVMVNAI